jgi:hypothetical protein
MAGSCLCISCAGLPVKDRSVAARSHRCPDCQSDLGVTSYGSAFRMASVKRKKIMTPSVLQAAIVGAVLSALVIALVGVPVWFDEKSPSAHHRAAIAQPEVVNELTRIPEVSLDAPLPRTVPPEDAKLRIKNLIEKIKVMNAAKPEGFLIAQVDHRKELRGMPFIMGRACRMQGDKAVQFQSSVSKVRTAVDSSADGVFRGSRNVERHLAFWSSYQEGGEAQNDAGIAALTQILGPEQLSLRASLAQHLAGSMNGKATQVLAKAAIFDPASEVRSEAIKALKNHPKEQYTEVLLHGLRYPMPVVARRAAMAMIQLDRKDMVDQVVDFLGEAPPGDPAADEQGECTVREVVRVNHHRNCLMCHAPVATGSTQEVPGLIPTPGMPFPSLSREYYGDVASRGEPAVRADTTYLRQDFSVMMPVTDAAPWPELQRFDFLVRARVVEGKELMALQERVRQRAADFLSENHQAAVRVLRELTGQDAEPNQAAWQRVLGLTR